MERSLLAAAAGLAVALAALPATAQPKPGAAPAIPSVEIEEEADTGVKTPAAPDERKGHLYFGVGGTAMGPSGSMGPLTPSTTLASAGFGVSGFLGVGLGRHVTLQTIGDFTKFLAPGVCNTGCSGRTYSVGLGFTYHLAQGIAFDPWASWGVAYRSSLFEVVNPTNPDGLRITQAYRGIDWGRIALGGDFYPTPNFGFGPWLEMDLGTNFSWPKPLLDLPPDVSNSPRTYALFQVGVRFAFDPMRKASRPAVAKSSVGAPGY